MEQNQSDTLAPVMEDANPHPILSNPSLRTRFIDLYGIGRLLGNCIVADNYRVRAAFADSVHLSTLGREVFSELLPRHPRQVADLKLAIFLKGVCAEGLLLGLSSDPDEIRMIVTEEAQAGRIFFPWTYGRELHDAWDALSPELTTLDNRRTIQLLDELPIGVFQSGYSVTGPFGVLRASTARGLIPRQQAPGYLCSKATCHTTHLIHLTTGDSKIAKIGRAVSRHLLREHSTQIYQTDRVLREAHRTELGEKRYTNASALVDTLSDGLDLAEIRSIADVLLRTQLRVDGYRAELGRKLNQVIANPTELVSELSRASLLQLLLLHSDDEIVRSVDIAVRESTVVVEKYETRVSRVTRAHGQVRAEIGSLGVRFRGPIGSTFVADRLLRLLRSLYVENDARSPRDLAFQLDLDESESADQLLTKAIEGFEPSTLIDRLISNSRSTIEEVAELLTIANSGDLRREELAAIVCWKLGLATDVGFTESHTVLGFRDGLLAAVADGSPEHILRGHISNVFTSLERLLKRSLEYCGWALTTDHYLERLGFTFDPDKAGRVHAFIESHNPTSDEGLRLRSDGRNTLVPLSAAFARLAGALRAQDPTSLSRPTEQFPEPVRLYGLPFCWRSTLPFLDLSEEAQSGLLADLAQISKLLQDDAVVSTRNAFLHDSESIPAPDQIVTAMDRVHQAVEMMRFSGLSPQVFKLDRTTIDTAGRITMQYTSEGRTIDLRLPLASSGSRLPNQVTHLLIVPRAVTCFGDPLRFRMRKRAGPDDYWLGWPKRIAVSNSYLDLQSDDAMEPDEFEAAG